MIWFLRFFTVVLLSYICPVYADVSGNVTISSNYIWRGVTQTNDNSAISAGIVYHTDQGSYLGIWSSNINYANRPSYELNTYIGHKFDLEPATIDIAARNYYFPSGGKYSYDFQPDKWKEEESSSFNEFHIGITRAGLNVGISYSNNYLDSGYSGYYIELNSTHQVTDELSIKLHIGTQTSTAIDDIPEESVSDRSVTFKWRNIFFTSSNLDDNRDGRQSDHERYVLGWSIFFGG